MLAASAVARHSTDPSYGIYAYTAREWDTETNLYYYRARYYDPKVGRFQSEDPVRSQAGERTLNLYRYVADNPSNYLDPTGLQWVPPRGADGNPMTTGVQPEANMYGGEAHAYFVGGGAVTVTCKDECGKKRTFRFAKACVGAGLGGSLAAGYVNGIEGRRCRAESYEGFFYEVGGAWGPWAAGADFGYNSDGPFGGPGSLSGVTEISYGAGKGYYVKSTWCYYFLIP